MKDGERTFRVARERLARNVVLCLAFVAIGLWMIGIFGSRPAGLRSVVFGVLGVVFAGGSGVGWLLDLLRDKPAIVVRHDGLDLPSSLGDLHLAWKEIASVDVIRVRGMRFLTFTAVDSESVIRRMNWLKAMLTKWNQRKYGSVGWVSAASLAEFDQVVTVVTDAFERRRGETS